MKCMWLKNIFISAYRKRRRNIKISLSSKEIADRLYISIHTVNMHRKNMLEKMKCKKPLEVINFSNTKGLALAS